MRFAAWAIFLSAPLLVAGVEAPTLLKGEALKSLLVGKDIEPLPNAIAPYGVERLHPTGRWCEEAHRATFYGSYRIADDMLCVKNGNRPEFCRIFFRDKDGRILVRNAPAAENPGALREYQVRPIERPLC